MQKLSSLTIAIYVAALLYANIFFIQKLTLVEGADQLFWNHLAIFLILLIPIYFIINKHISTPYSRGRKAPFKTLLVGLALIGLVMAGLYHIIPLEPIYDLPSYVDQVFASDTSFTIWLLVPLVILFL